MSFGKMQQIVYNYVISKQTQMREYAALLAMTTDTFWVEEFDTLWIAYNRSLTPLYYYNELAYAISAVSDKLCEFFLDPMEHPPGYVPVVMVRINADLLTDSTLAEIADKIEKALA